jgi:ribonuclease VapC
MVIDTSALLAIILREPEAARFTLAVQESTIRLVSVASALEAAIGLQGRLERVNGREVDDLIQSLPLEIWPIDLDQLHWARFAFETYGRGRHPAKLNFGDCLSYALAKTTGEPLLYKGSDFAQTDLSSAAPLANPPVVE